MAPDWWTISGTVIGAISLVVAGVQTVRYQVAKRLLKRISEREQVATWALYDRITQAYDDVGEARQALRSTDAQSAGPSQVALTHVETAAWTRAVEKTAQTAAILNAMWLNTIEHASSLEPVFEEATVERWKELGRLNTPWRIERARKLLPAISDAPLP